jgi:hypothetical protein
LIVAGELIAHWNADAWYRESGLGYDLSRYSVPVGWLRGIPLPKIAPPCSSGTPAVPQDGYNALVTLPGSLAIGTGITLTLGLTDDGASTLGLGKVIQLGVSIKLVSSGSASTDLSAGGGSEQTVNVTLATTAQTIVVATLAIASANLNGAGPGDTIALRLRRVGTAVADTCPDRAVLLFTHVSNT